MLKVSKFLSLFVFCVLFFVSCGEKTPEADVNEVVVYVALDQDFSKPMFELFEKKTGIKVKAKFDTEDTKTTGLVNAIIAGKDKQICDVFWNNEIVQTIKLKMAGLTQKVEPANAAKIPAQYKDKDGHWYGLAARSRVVLINKKRFAEKFPGVEYPSSFEDLLDPKWGAEAAYAKPLNGTTATHFSVILSKLGMEAGAEKLKALKNSDIQIKSSNGQTMRDVRDGVISWAWTDTDDAAKALAEKGDELVMLYTSAWNNDSGALVLPNTVCLIKDAPHKAAAEKFINFVLSEEVEKLLAEAAGKQIPLKPGIAVEGVDDLEKIKETSGIFEVDFDKVGTDWDKCRKILEDLYN